MIKVKIGQETNDLILFIEKSLLLLAQEKYDDFLSMYDTSRVSKEGLLLALRYLDESQPIVKVDDPMKTEWGKARITAGQFKEISGYWIDYDLSTNGEPNDLTLQAVFIKQGEEYSAELSDLRTL